MKVGDTITDDKLPARESSSGFKPSQPVVFCGMFPVDSDDYEHMRDSMSKLALNDSSFLMAGSKSCFRLWFSLWFSWSVTFRNYQRSL